MTHGLKTVTLTEEGTIAAAECFCGHQSTPDSPLFSVTKRVDGGALLRASIGWRSHIFGSLSAQPIDLVYPLKAGGSRADDAELRYSLRSVVANVQLPLGRLFLFGHRPTWLTDDVVHVPMSDRGDKAINLREKYRAMCDTDEISDPFLLLDDDHTFLQPTTEIPLHTMGALKDLCDQYRGRMHGRYLLAAYQKLVREKLPTRSYQIHYPMLVDKATLARSVELMTAPMVMGSIYGNLVDGPTVEVAQDFRVNRPAQFEDRKGGAFVSFAPIMRPEWMRFLEERFPDPSPWETAAVAKVAA